MAHVMKHTKASCGHMFAHFDRKAQHISNENLDRTRTHLNYNLAIHQQMDQGEFVRQRCSEVHCQNRKDVNVMVSWAVTAPKDLPEQEHKAFFQASYDFLEKKYGKENVVSAYVHMDEVTPHMHFAFVPVVFDSKKERYKVSAKERITRLDLKNFHSDLQKHVEQELGHEVSILNDATKEGNRSIEELKRQSATERLNEVNERVEKASKIVMQAKNDFDLYKGASETARAEFEALKAYIDAADRASEVSVMYPAEAKVTEKGLISKQKYVTIPAEMWEAKHVSAGEKEYLKYATDALEQRIDQFKASMTGEALENTKKGLELLEYENKTLRRNNNSLQDRLNRAEYKLERSEEQHKNFVKRVLSKIPEESRNDFINAWNREKAIDRARAIEMPEMER